MNFMLSAIIWNVGRVCFVSHRGTLDSTVPPCRFFKVGKCIYGENCRYFSKLLSGYVWRWVSWFDHSTFSIGICTKWMLNPMNCPTVQLMLRHWVSHKQASLNGFTHISFTASFDAIFHLTMLFSLDWVNAPEFIPSSVVYYPAAADSQFDFPAIKSSEKTSKWKSTIRDFSKMYKFSAPLKKLDVDEQEEAGPSTSQQPPVKSYAKAVDPNAGQSFKIAHSTSQICPYYYMGSCRYGEECTYIHGDVCELCGLNCLHPTDEAQRDEHNQVN